MSDIQRDPEVALSYSGKAGIFSAAGIFVAVEGQAELIRDRAAFQRRWTVDLGRWFERGVDTSDLVLIKVKARRITYWDGGEEGEVVL